MMQANEVREAILEKKLIAIVRGIERGKIIKTVNALLRGGISLVEITLDQSDERKMQEAFESIRCIRNEFAGRLFPGAGTVLSPAQATLAIEAGAQYIVSPDMNPGVIRRCKELGAVSIPGALTPTEIAGAVAAGADFVKLFPARFSRVRVHQGSYGAAVTCSSPRRRGRESEQSEGFSAGGRGRFRDWREPGGQEAHILREI